MRAVLRKLQNQMVFHFSSSNDSRARFRMFFSLCSNFYDGHANLEHIIWAGIVFTIAKTKSIKCTTNFRPINLINSSINIISKIRASRLNLVFDELIGEY